MVWERCGRSAPGEVDKQHRALPGVAARRFPLGHSEPCLASTSLSQSDDALRCTTEKNSERKHDCPGCTQSSPGTPADTSKTIRRHVDNLWILGGENYPRPELHAFIEKSRCAATSSRGGSCRRRTTDPQRLGGRATLPRCDVLQNPPIPQRTVALSPPVAHRFPGRGIK